MASFIVDNNIEGLVDDNPLASGALTLNLVAGEGAGFPSTFPFPLTIWNELTYPDPTDDSGMEIVWCTGRTVDALTIVRAKEDTADVTHNQYSRVALLLTSGMFNDATYGITTKLDTIEVSADVTDAANVATAGAVMDSDISEAEGFIRKTGSGAYEAIKSNLNAAVPPTVNDDSDDGYAINSDWIDTTADKSYQCLDATVGAAVWTEISAGAAAAHDLGGANHNADTLTNLNSKVTDATLIDTGDARLSDDRNPTAHASEHTDGTDDIQDATSGVKGLATSTQITKLDGIDTGADVTGDNPPQAHETSHESGGSDELDFDQLADGTTHKKLTAAEQGEIAANTTHKTSNGSDHSFIDQSVIIGSSPAIDGANVTDIPADNVNFGVIGTPTYKTAQDWFNVIQTAGIISGFVLSNGRDAAELDVAAGTGIVKIIDSSIGGSVSFNYAGANNITLTNNNINYIYLDYNLGTPQVIATTDRTTIELNRQFILGRVYKIGAILHILNAGVHLPNLARTEHERLVERDGFDHISGAVTTHSTLDLIITAGVWYIGHNRIISSSFDSSGADTWIYTHYGLAAWITDDAAASAVDTTHYNAGTDALGNLGVNNYGTQWVYICTDNCVSVIYGTENGTLAAAEAATPPTSIPLEISTMGELIAKIIIRQTGVIISVQSVHDIVFHATGVPNHNDLGGLQGGAASDYYHLTSVQETDLTDAGDSALHYHSTDRSRANHTGTQASSTITALATARVLGRKTAGAGVIEELTAADILTIINVESGADVTDAVNIASSIVGVDAKATPIDADTLPLIDSAAANVLKELTWANVKATLKTYFDALYNLYTHPNHTGDVTSVADGATTITAGAVDVAMLANGTDGELITWDAAGAPDTVAVGTADQILTSNGPGAAPTFQAAGAAGDLIEKVWFPAESAYLPVDDPATLTEELGATVYAGQSHLDFDDTTAEHAVWRGPIIDYDGGNIVINASAKIATTPASAKTLIFHIYTVGIANSEAYDAAVTVDTGVDITFNVDTSELLTDMIKATATIDPANVADGDKIVIELIRNVATDTLVGDGELIDFTIEYTKA